VKDPETYLNHLGIALPCPVRAPEPAILDAAHRAMVNHEIYFFSSEGARERFLKDPLRWCGLLTDPVSGERFQPSVASDRLDYSGRAYYFTSGATRAAFAKSPGTFANPKRQMPAPPARAPGDPAAAAPGAPATQSTPGAAATQPAPK